MADANNYTGNTTISSGTTGLALPGPFPAALARATSSLGVLDLNGYNGTIDGLSGSGVVDNSGTAAATLTIGANECHHHLLGSITISGTGRVSAATLSLVKTGTGVLTLSGTDTYTVKPPSAAARSW